MAQVEFNVPGPGTYMIEADPSLPPLAQPGTAADVLDGEQFYDNEGNPITGTMPSNPAEAVVIQGGGSYTIPKGYHTGQGTVTSSGSVLPTLTDPADAGEIVSGKEVIDQNGAVLTGTMPSNPAISETLEAGESYQVPAGYTPGGTVQAASLASQTPGTATQDDIIQGQTAWVNGVQITGALEPGTDPSDATATAEDILDGETAYVATGKVQGTMPNNGAVQQTLQAGGQYTIPAGHHNGQGTVTAQSLADQTTGTATAPDILNGETAWVNGAQVTGSMPDNGAVTKEMTAGETYNIPAGYHNGSGTVAAPTVASETPGTAVAGDLRQGKTAWVAGEQLTGTVPDVEAATPTISVSPEGLITAQTEQTAGYVAEATKAASQQLQTQGAQTITPGTSQQTINGGVYLTGAQTIQGDTGLVPENIKKGITIFNVTGSYEGETGGDFAVPLTITVDSGVTVNAINGDTTLTAVSNGTAQFILPKGGTWTITATKDGETAVTTVTVQGSYTGELEFIAGEVVYYGTATNIMAGHSIAGASVGDYAIFAGGQISSTHNYQSYIRTVYAFNSSLTRSTPESLPRATAGSNGENFSSHAIFIGGSYWYSTGSSYVTGFVPEVTSYDDALTQTTPTEITDSIAYPVKLGNILCMLYSNTRSDPEIYSLDQSFTFMATGVDLISRSVDAGVQCGAYALFSNGLDVYCLDSSFTQQSLAQLTSDRGNQVSVAENGVYALFAGGYASSTYIDSVDAYDYSLTQVSAPSLSVARFRSGSGRLGDFAVFAGGSGMGGTKTDTDTYSSSLVHEVKGSLSTARYGMASANTGNYLLFGGGRPANSTYSGVVDVYQLNITT